MSKRRVFNLMSNWRLVFDEDDGVDNLFRSMKRFTNFVYSDEKMVTFDKGGFTVVGDLRTLDGLEGNVATEPIAKIRKISGAQRKAIMLDALPGMAMLDEIYAATTIHGDEFYMFSSSASMETLELIAECNSLDKNLFRGHRVAAPRPEFLA